MWVAEFVPAPNNAAHSVRQWLPPSDSRKRSRLRVRAVCFSLSGSAIRSQLVQLWPARPLRRPCPEEPSCNSKSVSFHFKPFFPFCQSYMSNSFLRSHRLGSNTRPTPFVADENLKNRVRRELAFSRENRKRKNDSSSSVDLFRLSIRFDPLVYRFSLPSRTKRSNLRPSPHLVQLRFRRVPQRP